MLACSAGRKAEGGQGEEGSKGGRWHSLPGHQEVEQRAHEVLGNSMGAIESAGVAGAAVIVSIICKHPHNPFCVVFRLTSISQVLSQGINWLVDNY
jgi:hypothetical protein